MSAPRRLRNWIDDRTGVFTAVDRFLGKTVPPKLPWSYTLGAVLLMLLGSQVVTGVVLAVYYAPTPDHAYDSIRFIERAVLNGRIVRGLHHWGASFLIVVMALHLIRVFAHGSYRKPREANWMLGVKLLFVVLAFGLTGYLLPWDQKAYWATTVTLRIANSVPVAGPFLASILGGPGVGAMTLNRFYAIHALILPAALLLLVAAHVALVQRHGTAGPPAPRAAGTGGDTFHPRQSARDAIAMAVIFAVLMTLAVVKGAPLDAVADPSDTAYVPRPEWYFLALFQMLKYFPGKLEIVGTVILPGLGALVLFLLPFLDRSADRRLGARRPLAAVFGAALAAVVILTALGARDRGGAPEPSWKKEGRTPFFAAAGPGLFEKQDCGSCHREDGTGAGPPLLAGSRTHTAAWIRDHMSDPEYVAPGSRDPERRVSGPETDVILAWLDFARSAPVAAAAPPEGAGLIAREGCFACHRIDGVGGRFAPVLNGVRERRDRAWIVNYIPDPTAVNPDAKMRAYPDLPLEDRERIADYLLTLR